jgi:hypothetical protein
MAAVTRSPFNLDVFMVDQGGVENVSWNNWNGPNAGTWIDTTLLGDVNGEPFPPGETISATGRNPVQLDVFDGTVTTEWWTESWSGGAWSHTLIHP